MLVIGETRGRVDGDSTFAILSKTVLKYKSLFFFFFKKVNQ